MLAHAWVVDSILDNEFLGIRGDVSTEDVPSERFCRCSRPQVQEGSNFLRKRSSVGDHLVVTSVGEGDQQFLQLSYC